MGHKERLLAGAKRSLLEHGYSRTTARDIVEASGTNLASIGYHYGSKDALLAAAMIEALSEWGDEVEGILRFEELAEPIEQIEAIWTRAAESIATKRQLWMASIEFALVAEREPAVRRQLGDALEAARLGLAAMASGGRRDLDPAQTRALGSLVLAVLEGLVLQQLIDPAHAPSGADLAGAVRALARLSADGPPSSPA